jgi:uncharacterized protein DUF3618
MSDIRTNDDPAAIEQDIRRTQDEMSRTVDKLGSQLTAKNLFNALLDKADEKGVDADYLIDGARRNPIALGLIAAGAIWLVSDKDSKFPSMPSGGKKPQAGTEDELDLYGADVHHRDYVTHMSSLEMRDGEDADEYQRRRDLHRANFLMCERNPDEDDHSFRQRLNEITDKFREKRRAWMDSASQTGSSATQVTQQFASRASTRAQDMYSSNPLVGGILAAAVGAALGSTIPVSRTEQEKLGGIGSKARDIASEQKEQLTDQVREKKDQVLERADEKLQQSSQSEGQQQQHQPQTADTPEFSRDIGSSSEGPFIISERDG